MLETQMVSVERCFAYTHLPQEGALAPTPTPPPSAWPSAGRIEFDNVVMGYRPGLPDVLKGISFTIAPGQKVISIPP